jgi:uncharacterized protein
MLMLLSPAKRLVEGPAIPDLPATQPVLLDETERLLARVRDLGPDDLVRLMGISEALAEKNHQRFQMLAPPFDRDNARQAVRLFDGDVYRGLDAAALSADDLRWAQDRVVILSGLYGAVRPLDLLQPYRLEMGSRLKTDRGEDLYAFWGDLITERLNGWLAARNDREVVDLASHEYFASVRPEKLHATVITPVFKDVSNGRAQTISFYAKKARGAMVRWAIEHRAERAAELKASDALGYAFQPDLSTDSEWLFTRPRPS